jgi:hypothetical protein
LSSEPVEFILSNSFGVCGIEKPEYDALDNDDIVIV